MEKNLLIFTFLLLISCKDEPQNNRCFNNVSMNQVVNLTNPEFVDLNVPGTFAKTLLQGRNVIIIRRNDTYKVFDLECPELDCNKTMTFDGLKLICPCSKKQYNSLNGSPIDGKGCFVLEYNSYKSGNTLQVTR